MGLCTGSQGLGFPKIRSLSGVPIIRIVVVWALYWVPIICGNYQMEFGRKWDPKPQKFPCIIANILHISLFPKLTKCQICSKAPPSIAHRASSSTKLTPCWGCFNWIDLNLGSGYQVLGFGFGVYYLDTPNFQAILTSY